jgi:hypothetical protein
VEYRGDLLQFRVEVSRSEAEGMAATWSFTDDAEELRP